MCRIVSRFVTLAVLLFATTAVAAPSMQVENPKYDFGEVYQGELVPHVYKFTNVGDEVLKIDRVQSSCGCTAVLLSEKSIPPGGSGEVKANFDSSRFRGEVSKTIYVYTNDPVRATWQLQLKGKVLEIVSAQPAQINFGDVVADKPVTTSVVLRNQGAESLEIGQSKSTAAELAVTMPPASFKPGEEARLELTLTPKPGKARFSGYVLVPITGIPKNELRIPVYATIKQ